MKTLRIVLFFMALGLGHSQAQVNLVPNPSFEILDSCPESTSQLNYISNWFVSRSSPDLFNGCDITNNVGVPLNLIGFRQAHSGNGYIGLHSYSGNSSNTYREYVGVKLYDSLQIGSTYYISFWVSPGFYNQQFKYVNDHLGILFTCDSLPAIQPFPITNYSHLFSNLIITDSINWTSISGSFIADSNYRYLQLGNFYDDILTNSINIFPNGSTNLSYYYFDDVCVSNDSIYCSEITSLGEHSNANDINVFPNPSSEFLHVSSLKSSIIELELINSLGVEIERYTNYGKVRDTVQNLINIGHLSAGVYFLRILCNDMIISKSFIKL